MSTRRMRMMRVESASALGLLATLLTIGATGCGGGGSSNQPPAIQQGTEIHVSDGVLQGEVDGGARRFLGIPYAAAPVGDRRWRPPEPPVPWTGIRPATAFGSSCALSSGGIETFSEDCLYLNLWTPDPAPTHPLPVMVWFHGGGNQLLSASARFFSGGFQILQYNGRQLAETRNVVVVTVNYRLGVFGFFGHDALASEDPSYPHAGNQGLLDQRAALQWVRENIGAFGGDRDNVTIFGESAGALDVCLHVVSPGSAGLFHRAISQSYGCALPQQTAADADRAIEQLIPAVGCEGSADALACLREVPAADLLSHAGDSFDVIVDGGFLPDQPRALLDAGKFNKVPYMLGSNQDEGNESISDLQQLLEEQGGYLEALHSRFGDRAEEVAALYPPGAFPPTSAGSSEALALARAVGDHDNVCQTHDTARRAAAGGADVYLYNFNRPDADYLFASLGADHQAEIGYLFGSIDLMTDENRDVSRAMQGYWTRFARNGDPNDEGAVEWPRYVDTSDRILHLDVPISASSGFRHAECGFWWNVYDQDFVKD